MAVLARSAVSTEITALAASAVFDPVAKAAVTAVPSAVTAVLYAVNAVAAAVASAGRPVLAAKAAAVS